MCFSGGPSGVNAGDLGQCPAFLFPFPRSISLVISLHPGPCIRLCLQGNLGLEESQGLSGNGGPTGKETEAQREEMRYTEYPEAGGRAGNAAPVYMLKIQGNRPRRALDDDYGCTQSPDPDGELCAGVRPGSMPRSATDMGPALKKCPVGWRDRQGNRHGSMSWLHGLLWLATRSVCSLY